ncbi:MAG: peroxidase family protein [Gemmataceae bacterium]
MSLSDRFFRMLRKRKAEKARLNLLPLEDRITPTVTGFRTIDGTMNNLQHSDWGSAGAAQIRIAPAAFADGISSPTDGRPSAREISNAVSDQGSQDIVSAGGLSAMAYAWGQFLDHDLDLTPTGSVPFNIPVPTGDPYFDPNSTGTQVIPMTRSLAAAGTGTSASNPRQEINNVSAWIDGSQIYGSDSATADSLRAHTGGRMKTSAGDLPPIDPATGMFMAGDIRANENPELTSLHTLFIREHNHIADRISQANPSFSDEQVYQMTRQRVIAELQVITYNEWLPTMLGRDALKPYSGYKSNVNPGIATEFSTAAFRLGHSMLGDDIEFLGNSGLPVADEVTLAEAFFNPSIVSQNGIDSVLKYLSSDPSSEIDTKVVNSLRNFLFGPPGSGGLDLVSLNIQRGRDHGLADYNSMRAAYGLPKVTSFAQITSNTDLQQKLQSLYGNVDNIDAWVGALAEDHVGGGNTGPMIRRVLSDQFQRLRDGDRFWYEQVFSGKDLDELRNTKLSDIIRRNTEITNIQPDAFTFRVSIDGSVFVDGNHDGHRQLSEGGVVGRTVQLLDANTNEVVATTVTGPKGDFHFNTLNGLGVGQFKVRQQTLLGWLDTSLPANVISLTRGGDHFDRVDLGTLPVNAPPPPTQQPPTQSGPGQPACPPPMSGTGSGQTGGTQSGPMQPPPPPPPPGPGQHSGGSQSGPSQPPPPPPPPTGSGQPSGNSNSGSQNQLPPMPPPPPPPPPPSGSGSSGSGQSSGGGTQSGPLPPAPPPPPPPTGGQSTGSGSQRGPTQPPPPPTTNGGSSGSGQSGSGTQTGPMQPLPPPPAPPSSGSGQSGGTPSGPMQPPPPPPGMMPPPNQGSGSGTSGGSSSGGRPNGNAAPPSGRR